MANKTFDSNSGEKFAKIIDNRIVEVAKQVYNNTPNDKEFEGRVIYKDKLNRYTVIINNSKYTNILQERSLGEISNGTIVKIKAPNGQMSNAYICGVVDGTVLSQGGGGEGSVTSVNVQGSAGISATGGPITSSGTITVAHTNSITPKTTQAIYPITIDGQGHINSIGNAKSIPTKTSDLTNDSGFITKSVNDLTNYTTTTALQGLLDDKVDKTTQINGRSLSTDINLTASDVEALPSTTTYVSTVNGNSGAVTVQPTLVSGTNIKTINNQSLLGSGNIEITSGGTISYYDNTPNKDGVGSAGTSNSVARGDHTHPTDTSRQETLISGTNIKTINNESILGSGNINTKTSLPLGMIFPSLVQLTDSAYHLLDGSSLAISGSYSAFCTWVQQQASAGKLKTCTIAEYVTDMTNTGQCGKFVINTTDSDQSSGGYSVLANSIKLPTITSHIEGTTDINELGNAVEAGLPNIYARFVNHYRDWNSNKSLTPLEGAIVSDGSTTKSSYPSIGSDSSGNYTQDYCLKLDASISSTVYGKSSTVQTNSIKYFFYIVVANSTKTNIEVDIDNVVSDLNNKANKDLSNVSSPTPNLSTGGTVTTHGFVTESYYNPTAVTWYRIWSDGWKECGGHTNAYQIIALPITFSNTNFSLSTSFSTQFNSLSAGASGWIQSGIVDANRIIIRVRNANSYTYTDKCTFYCCGY